VMVTPAPVVRVVVVLSTVGLLFRV
jgi:hypothetical protein